MYWTEVSGRRNWVLREDNGNYIACLAGDVPARNTPKDGYRIILMHPTGGHSILYVETSYRADELEKAKQEIQKAFE